MVYANCPVCIMTVGGGLFLAKKLGIDDLLVSIWISGLNTTIAFFIASKIKHKIFHNPFFWTLIFYVITIFYLGFTKQIFVPRNTFIGIDKIIFGMTVGVLIFFISHLIDQYLRDQNKGKVVFYYQKIVIPFLFLLFTTILFKFLLP